MLGFLFVLFISQYKIVFGKETKKCQVLFEWPLTIITCWWISATFRDSYRALTFWTDNTELQLRAERQTKTHTRTNLTIIWKKLSVIAWLFGLKHKAIFLLLICHSRHKNVVHSKSGQKVTPRNNHFCTFTKVESLIYLYLSK